MFVELALSSWISADVVGSKMQMGQYYTLFDLSQEPPYMFKLRFPGLITTTLLATASPAFNLHGSLLAGYSPVLLHFSLIPQINWTLSFAQSKF